jgi:predicted RNA-binding Zn-ribbon protein involved in translation (DUF1610 family)
LTERTAACPNCGAAITFRWSGAVQTTCPACRSILVRHDLNLEKVGVASDVPAAFSGIQLGTEGRFKGKPFTVVGRIIYKYDLGHWNEWHIRFSDDTSGWLSDAQAEYAVTRQSPQTPSVDIALGDPVKLGDNTFKAMSFTTAAYGGVEGELPFEYWDKEEVQFIDLRGPGDSFATIDRSETPALLFVGEYEDLSELRLRNLREDAGSTAVPTPKSLSCASCGSAIEIRTGELAKTVACPSCGAVMDTRNDQLRTVLNHQDRIRKVSPQIPLGSVGQLKGRKWTVIGYQIRGISVEGINYDWREYLLWNAESGFRYLTEYEGHWNDVTTVKGLPREYSDGGHLHAEYLGTKFKHFQNARATTRFVLGEFPWEVRVGDQVWNDDFVAPPLMLSREGTENEITWSMGTYTSPASIQEAFKLPDALPRPNGVFANQPNPTAGRGGMTAMFALFAATLIGMCGVRQVTADNKTAFSGGFRFDPRRGDTAAFVTEVFELKGRKSNVQVGIETDLSNDNAYFNVALLPESPGKGFEMGRDVSYYFGVDQGERWSEGRPTDRAIIGGVPGGRYYLRIEPEHAGMKPVVYTVTAKRDVPRTWPFMLALIPLALPPLFGWLSRQSFESRRWLESDYAPEEEEDDDE